MGKVANNLFTLANDVCWLVTCDACYTKIFQRLIIDKAGTAAIYEMMLRIRSARDPKKAELSRSSINPFKR